MFPVQAKPAPSRPLPVLVVGNDQYGVLAAVRAVRAAGYAPWLAVHQRGTYAGRSRVLAGTVSVSDPELGGEEFVSELARAAIRLRVAAVLPSAETHLLALAGREAAFGGIALGVPSREAVERATDKALLPTLASTAGLQTPRTSKIDRRDCAAKDGLDFPLIVKPLRSRICQPDGTVSAHSVRYVSTRRQAEEALEALPGGQGLVQAYIPGQLVSVSGVCWRGEVICAMHQASLRVWPLNAGVSAYAETIVPNVKLDQGVGRLVRAIGWSGLFQVQFIRSTSGEFYLLDLNPRIYGSLALAVAAGLNLPAIWADLLVGRRPDVGGYRVGVRFRHEEKDVPALFQMLLNSGSRPRATRALLPKPGTTHAIGSLRDPMPLLTSTVKVVRRLKHGQLIKAMGSTSDS